MSTEEEMAKIHDIANPNRIEEIPIVVRLWGEGVGIPDAVWNDKEIQREVLDMKDGAGVMKCLTSYSYSFAFGYEFGPKQQLECMAIIDKYCRHSKQKKRSFVLYCNDARGFVTKTSSENHALYDSDLKRAKNFPCKKDAREFCREYELKCKVLCQ